jgi:hypothetical protein
MKTYKVIFARNNAIMCELLPHQVKLKNGYYYEHEKGKLIYALIEADSEEEALIIADRIIKEVYIKVFGQDFVA